MKQDKGTLGSIKCASHAKYPARICLLHFGKCTKYTDNISFLEVDGPITGSTYKWGSV